MYGLLRTLLFLCDTETSHNIALKTLKWADYCRLLPFIVPKKIANPVVVAGLSFENPVGLAAGLDKNGDYISALKSIGFGFLEIGTVTPKAQSGNDQPRLFRLASHEAILNRMGFNNKGVKYLVEQAKLHRSIKVLGINIGKNKITPDKDALLDYCCALHNVYPFADYIAVNISSPNTPGLRSLQYGEQLNVLLQGIKEAQQKLHTEFRVYKPIFIKIAPDMDEPELRFLIDSIVSHDLDGVIATNTTIDQSAIVDTPLHGQAGGLSGKPLMKRSTEVIEIIRSQNSYLPIIGVGGILCGDDAVAKVKAGADLVQLYSGLIYRGPTLVHEVNQSLSTLMQPT